jgi:putative ABC transport system permease protein
MKSRGARTSQILRILAAESFILGAIGGCIGLLVGVGLSRFLLSAAASFLGNSASVPPQDVFNASWGTVSFSVAFGVILMLVASLPNARRISDINPAEALHQYSYVSEKMEYNPRWDLAVLAIIALGLLSSIPQSRLGGGAPVMIQVIGMALYSISMVVTPLIPFLLTFSLIRVLTRSSGRWYTKFASVLRPLTGGLHDIVIANIARNPRRVFSICMMISLSVSLSMVASIAMESSISHEYEVLRFEVGADIRLESACPSSISGFSEESEILMNSLRTIDDIEEFCVFSSVLVYTTAGSAEAAFIDPTAYQMTIGDDALDAVGLDAADVQLLDVNDAAIVTEWFASMSYVKQGDTIFVAASIYNSSTEAIEQRLFPLTIGLIVDGLPGLSQQSVVAGKGTLESLGDNTVWASVGAFIAARDSSDEPSLAQLIESQFLSAGFSEPEVRVLTTETDEVTNEPYFGALAQFLYTETALIILTMSVGVGMFMYMAVIDRERELACIVARGASRTQVRRMMMGESLTEVLIGLMVGAVAGLLAVASLMAVLGRLTSTPVQYALPFSSTTAILLIGHVGLLIFASELSAVRAGGIKLASLLRLRGG